MLKIQGLNLIQERRVNSEYILFFCTFLVKVDCIFIWYLVFLQLPCSLTCQPCTFRLFACTKGSGSKNTHILILLWLDKVLVLCIFHGKLYANSRLNSILILVAMLLHTRLLGLLGAKLFATPIIQPSAQIWFPVFSSAAQCTIMML